MAIDLPAHPNTRKLRAAGAPPVVFGHRGMPERAPENTLPSFALILENGIRGVELDIHQCATGELVVSHDDTLARTSGADISLVQASLAEIREHDVGAWFDERFKGETVPTLSEVFELLGTKVLFDIEVKHHAVYWGPPLNDGPEATLARLIRRHGLHDNCLVSSFDPLILRRFARTAPEIPTALIYANHSGVPVTIRRGRGRLFCRPAIMKPAFIDVGPHSVRTAHRRGRQVVPWTVGDPADAVRLADLGADGLISRVPDVIQAALADPR